MVCDHHVHPVEHIFIESLFARASMPQALSGRKSRYRATNLKYTRRDRRAEEAQRRDRTFLSIIDAYTKEEMFADDEQADVPWFETDTFDADGVYIRPIESKEE